jgi:hypothetical protein
MAVKVEETGMTVLGVPGYVSKAGRSLYTLKPGGGGSFLGLSSVDGYSLSYNCRNCRTNWV